MKRFVLTWISITIVIASICSIMPFTCAYSWTYNPDEKLFEGLKAIGLVCSFIFGVSFILGCTAYGDERKFQKHKEKQFYVE